MKRDTAKNKKMFLDIFEKAGCNIKITCKKMGMPRQTFYLWKKKDEKFAKEVNDIYEGLIDFAESKLMQKIKDDDTTALLFFLKTKAKHRGYAEKPEMSVNVNANQINKIDVEFIE